MVTDLTNSMLTCRNGWLLPLLCSMFFSASAQALTDPTKPPAELSAPPAPGGQGMLPRINGLQTIIISLARRAAIIDGQTVELGAYHGDAKLIEVSESGVVLQGSQGRQVLALFPGVEIKKKEVLLPMENEMKHPAHKTRLLNKPGRQAGKKEEK
jgi:MSHA biogenesis protein MshK